MYAAHQGGTALRTEIAAEETIYPRDGVPANFWGVKGSASLKGKTLVVSLARPDTKEALIVDIRPRGATIRSGRITTLTNSVLNAHNTFEQPNLVRPTTRDLKISAGGLTVELSAASVNVLELTLV
jgi:alpha-N-arabinofuranosidase